MRNIFSLCVTHQYDIFNPSVWLGHGLLGCYEKKSLKWFFFFPSNYRWNRCIPNMVRSNELKMFDHKFEWDIWNEAVVAMMAMVTASLPLICMNEYVGNLRKTVFDVRIWCDDHLHVFHRLHSFKVFDAEIDGIY